MSKRLKKHLGRSMAILIAVTHSLPASARISQTQPAMKIAVIEVRDAEAYDGEASRLAVALRSELQSIGNVIPADVTEPLLSLKDKTDSLDGIDGEVTRILGRYYGFKSDENAVIRDLENVLDKLNSLEPSRRSSALMVSLRMTLAWLKFQRHDTRSAAEHLRAMFVAANPESVGLDAYPSSFRRFATATHDELQRLDKTFVVVESAPPAAPFFVDGIMAGITPATLDLPEKSYTIAVSAPGRKSESRALEVTAGRKAEMRVRLKWRGDKGRSGDLRANTGIFTGVNPGWIAKAGAIREAVQSDAVVFLGLSSNDSGSRVSARVYDGRYRQFLKTISGAYDKDATIGAIAFDVARKLRSDLTRNKMTYWSRGVEREWVADHRLATRKGKPLYRQPLFWAAIGVLAAGAVTAGIMASQADSGAKPATGGLIVGF